MHFGLARSRKDLELVDARAAGGVGDIQADARGVHGGEDKFNPIFTDALAAGDALPLAVGVGDFELKPSDSFCAFADVGGRDGVFAAEIYFEPGGVLVVLGGPAAVDDVVESGTGGVSRVVAIGVRSGHGLVDGERLREVLGIDRRPEFHQAVDRTLWNLT